MKTCLFLCMFAFSILSLQAQDSWKTYRTADNLPNNQVNVVALDGSVQWFGTAGGVGKFYGTGWTIYTRANSGLVSDSVQAIGISSGGIKWFGTFGGLSKYDGSSWTSYTMTNSQLPSNDVRALVFSPNGTLWIATANGLVSFDGTYWTIYNKNNSQISSNRILSLAFQGNTLWIGTEDAGVATFDGTSWSSYSTTNSPILSNIIFAVAIDASGTRWFGTWGGGVSKFDGTLWKNYTQSNSGLPYNWIHSLTFDACGSLWIGTRTAGLAKFDGLTWFTYNSTNSGLPDNYVFGVQITYDGYKWIATNNGSAKFLDKPTIKTLSLSQSSFCTNDVISISFSITGTFPADNKFTAELSDSNGSFTLPIAGIQVANSCPTKMTFKIPTFLAEGTKYRIRISSTNPATIGSDNGANFAIHPLPVTKITPDSSVIQICAGDSVNFTASGGATYLWSNGLSAQKITVKNAGKYSVKATSPFGCESTASVTVQVVPLPSAEITIKGTTAICEGDSVLLSAPANYQYAWSSGETAQTISVKNAGLYQVEVKNIIGCITTSKIIKVKVQPIAKPVVSQKTGDTIACSTSASYQWNLGGIPITGATQQTFLPKIFGSYSVTVRDTNGCFRTSDVFNFATSSVENEPKNVVSADGFVLFPNPAGNEITLVSASMSGIVHLEITDILGRHFMADEFINSENSWRQTLKTADLPRGIYFLRVSSQAKNRLLMFLKE